MKYIKKFENKNKIKIGDKIIIRNLNEQGYYEHVSNNYYLNYIKRCIGTIRKLNFEYKNTGINYAIVDYLTNPPYECEYLFTYHDEDNTYSTMINLDYFDYYYGTIDEIKDSINLETNINKYNL